MDDAKRGQAAIEAKQYAEAIQHFTNAIAKNPDAPSYYILRSTAHNRNSPPNRQEAISDAELAVALSVNRPREMMMDAQERRYMALYNMGRYEDARFVWDYANTKNQESMAKEAAKKEKNEPMNLNKYEKKSMPLNIWGSKIAKALTKAKEELEKIQSSPADHFDGALVAATEAFSKLGESSADWKDNGALQAASEEIGKAKTSPADWNEKVFKGIAEHLDQAKALILELNTDAAKAAIESLEKLLELVHQTRELLVKTTCNVQLIPDKQVIEARKTPKPASASTALPAQTGSKGPKQAATPLKASPELNKTIKRDWIQNAEYVTITVSAKAVPIDSISIEFQERSVSLSFPIPGRLSYTHDETVDPLFAAIDPTQSRINVTPNKIEIILKKTQNIKWSKLEGAVQNPDDSETPQATGLPMATTSTAKSSGPVYPTSSKSGPKNWDKVVNDLSRKPKKDGDKDDGKDEMDDLEGGDPVNDFFKVLYKDADDDTRRAMMKSYQESNGTALSTNWAEVSKGKVETSAPDGMVAKKWGE